MTEPKVELKNIKTFVGNEGYGLNATMYISGIKCLFVMDHANGGIFEYDKVYDLKHKEEAEFWIKELYKWIDQLPLVKCGTFSYKTDMDTYVNIILERQEEAKANAKHKAKMVKMFEHAIVFGVPNADRYKYWDAKQPLSNFPLTGLQYTIDRNIKPHCVNGVVILNTNLEELGVKV